MSLLNSTFDIVKEISLKPFIVLVIYYDGDTKTNDAILVKDKPQSQSLSDFNIRAVETILVVSMRRKNENRTETMTLEQLAFVFVEFVCIKENRDVVISWMKELQNEQS